MVSVVIPKLTLPIFSAHAGKKAVAALTLFMEKASSIPNTAVGRNTSAQVTVTLVGKSLPFPLSHLRGLMPNCFSCLLPPLIPAITTLCPNSEQHHEQHQSSRLYLFFSSAKTSIPSCRCLLVGILPFVSELLHNVSALLSLSPTYD